MASSTNQYVIQLEDLEIFQGDTVTLSFTWVDGENNPIDLTNSLITIQWRLCPYGKYDIPVVDIDNKTLNSYGLYDITVDDVNTNVCYVHLNENITGNLDYGKYTQQPILTLQKTSTNGTYNQDYVRAEGTILIKEQIANT